MPHYHVDDLHKEADDFATSITFVCSLYTHQSTTTKLQRLILSRPPPDFTIHHKMVYEKSWNRQSRVFILRTIESSTWKLFDPL